MTETNAEYLTALAAQKRAANAKRQERQEARTYRDKVQERVSQLLSHHYLHVEEEREKCIAEKSNDDIAAIDEAISIHRRIAKPFKRAALKTLVVFSVAAGLFVTSLASAFLPTWNSALLVAACGTFFITGLILFALLHAATVLEFRPATATAVPVVLAALIWGGAFLNEPTFAAISPDWAWRLANVAVGIVVAFSFDTRRIAKAYWGTNAHS